MRKQCMETQPRSDTTCWDWKILLFNIKNRITIGEANSHTLLLQKNQSSPIHFYSKCISLFTHFSHFLKLMIMNNMEHSIYRADLETKGNASIFHEGVRCLLTTSKKEGGNSLHFICLIFVTGAKKIPGTVSDPSIMFIDFYKSEYV
ncbi:unnamed protein product [Cuscuta epithymum]|uniref:Uncharacterized protein n=1 Tax=Cuscuta epithymum TaxID=186058 RepID=A0AAV0C5D8_9ASTE|nr:unnamed protein product [Cuscuta epithymum]